MKPVVIPIQDVLDLHAFLPKEVPDLLRHYMEECRQAGIYSLRVIHGKGTGALRETVRACLSRSPMVENFQQAPHEAGGWGATLVNLKR